MQKSKGLDEIAANIIRRDLKKVKNYACVRDATDKSTESIYPCIYNGINYLYSISEVAKLMNITNYRKSINNYSEPKEKIRLYVFSQKKLITLLTIKGIHRLINEHYPKNFDVFDNDQTQPFNNCNTSASDDEDGSKSLKLDKIICDFFQYDKNCVVKSNKISSESVTKPESIENMGKPGLVSNIYVKKLQNTIFPKENIQVNWLVPNTNKTIDVFFPKKGIAILFETKRIRALFNEFKKKSVITAIKKTCPSIKGDIQWLRFSEYNKPHATNEFHKLLGSINNALYVS